MSAWREFIGWLQTQPALWLVTTSMALLLAAWLADFVTKRVLLRALTALARLTPTRWDDALFERGVVGFGLAEHLHRDRSAQGAVGGPPHLAHPAAGDRPLQPVPPGEDETRLQALHRAGPVIVFIPPIPGDPKPGGRHRSTR